jgi:DNA end-binding protein Ku
MDLKEFIPLASVEPIYLKYHYRGAGKGGEKPHRLLADAMAKSARVAIAELVSRGKEQLVLIRPYRKGIVLHTITLMRCEILQQVPKGEKLTCRKKSWSLASG